MPTPGLKVSPEDLIFCKSKAATKSIKIETTNNERVGVFLKHNLPLGMFTVTYPVCGAPCDMKIIYDPSSNATIPKDMAVMIGVVMGEKVEVRVKFEPEIKTSEALDCKVCLLQYSEEDESLVPRILTGCGHTICQKCVTKIQSTGNQLLCPFDRKPTSINGTVLPKNFTIIELLREKKEAEVHQKLEEITIVEDPDVPCGENPKHESTCYCTTCKMELCSNCFKLTHASKIFSGHQAVPLSERPVVFPNCEIHSDKKAFYLCQDKTCETSEKLFCDECRLDEHKSHVHGNLKDSIMKNQENLEETVKKLKSSETKFQLKLETAQKCQKSFHKEESAYKSKQASIIKHFDTKKEEALKKLDDFVDSKLEKLVMESEEIEHSIGLITETRKQIERVLKKRTNLHDVKEIMEEGKALCSLEADSVNFLPFFSNLLPDDMSIEVPKNTIPQAPAREKAKPGRVTARAHRKLHQN